MFVSLRQGHVPFLPENRNFVATPISYVTMITKLFVLFQPQANKRRKTSSAEEDVEEMSSPASDNDADEVPLLNESD